MAYQSSHTGPEVDAAVEMLSQIQDARDATAEDRAEVQVDAQEVHANAVQVASQTETVNNQAATVQTLAMEVEQAHFDTVTVAATAVQARDIAVSSASAAQASQTSATASEQATTAAAQQAADAADIVSALAPQVSDDADSAQQSATSAAASAASAAAVVTGGTASLTPAAGKIPLADGNGKIADGWLGAGIARSDAVAAATQAAALATTRTAPFLNPAASNPSTRFDGSPLQAGDRYFNTTAQGEYLYTSAGWVLNDAVAAVDIVQNDLNELEGQISVEAAPGGIPRADSNGDISEQWIPSALLRESSSFDFSTVGASLLSSKALPNYTALRAYQGAATVITITDAKTGGVFNRVSVTSPVDNEITRFVDALGRAWDRDFDGATFDPYWAGASGAGITSDVPSFSKVAALAGNDGIVRVRKGTFLIDSLIPTKTNWDIDYTARITGLANIPPAATMNTSNLNGMLYFRDGYAQTGKVYYGPSDYSIIPVRGRASTLAMLNALSPKGATGLNGMAVSSLNLGTNDQSCIGVQGIGFNDNATQVNPVWGGYIEAGRTKSGVGPVFGVEIDCFNGGSDSIPYTPFMSRTLQDHLVANLSLGAGGGGGLPNIDPVSAALGIGPNGSTFRRGILFRNGALTAEKEAVAAPRQYAWQWYWETDTQGSTLNDTFYKQQARSLTDTGCARIRQIRYRYAADGFTPLVTENLDAVGVIDAYAYNGTAEISAFTQTIRQRSAWSAGQANFGWSIAVNQSGTNRGIELCSSASNAFNPSTTNVLSLGAASFLWTQVFATNATISTSDARLKTEVRPFSAAEIEASKLLAKEVGLWKWLDKVGKEGDDAREHCGMTVQRAIEIMESQGLDPFAYSFICYDSWDAQTLEHPEELDEDGEVVAEGWTETLVEAGDRYSFRESGLQFFIARGFEARLAAIENFMSEDRVK